MLSKSHIFRNPHPGIAVLLVLITFIGTGILNFFRSSVIPEFNFDFWLGPICIGLASWLINVILVYRSRYLLSNYLLGWSWWCLLIALTNEPLTWKQSLLSIGVAIWLAITFELSDERKTSLRTRSNLGFVSALLGFIHPSLFSLLAPSVLSLSIGLKTEIKAVIQVSLAWLLPIVLYVFFLIFSSEQLPMLNNNFNIDISSRMPLIGEYIILMWGVFAIGQTLKALVNAKKPKRRGLLLSWVGIGYAIVLAFLFPGGDEYVALLAVFFGPHLVNLKDYIHPKKLRYWLTPSLIFAAIIQIMI